MGATASILLGPCSRPDGRRRRPSTINGKGIHDSIRVHVKRTKQNMVASKKDRKQDPPSHWLHSFLDEYAPRGSMTSMSSEGTIAKKTVQFIRDDRGGDSDEDDSDWGWHVPLEDDET
jgi:hypothetical protein